MVGEFDNPKIRGIIPRSLDYIFKKINKLQNEEPNSKYNINISLIQIYLEMIQDLFEPNNQVKIREDPDKGVFLENCLWINIKNSEEFKEAFKKGEKNRVTECTKMNAQSSRSHVILIVKIQKNFIDEESNEYIMTQGKLYLVDLAGSERVTKTNAREMRLEEAKKINYSLLILGNCIQSLISPNSKYISYRDSKLTRILQDSLGGNAKTSLIVTISPSGYNTEETLSSLNFGLRAMKVQNRPVINKTQDYQALFYKLQEDYDKLLEEKTNLTIEYNKVCDENDKFKSNENYLNIQKNKIEEQIKNNSKSISLEEVEKIKKKFEKEMKNLEKYYSDVLKNKEEENEKIMKDIDNVLVKKDNEIQNTSSKLNEYKIKLKNVTDINYDMKKKIEEIQKTCNNMLSEKEELNYKINTLTEANKNLTKNINILNNKKDSLISEETQTDSIINTKLKELLNKYKISNNDISNNNLQNIISQLLISLETMNNDAKLNNMKLKKMNENIKNYEEKIKKLNNENTELKNNIQILKEEKKEIDSLNNDFKILKENELLECKNKIEDLQIRVQQIDEDKKNFEEIKKNFENEINELKKNNKILNMNNQSLDSELKRIQGSFGNNEKNLIQVLTQIYKDNNLFSQFKKQLKKLDTIIDNDLVNINENNYEYSMNKAKTEGNKFKSMIKEVTKNQTELLNSENFNNKVNNDKYFSNNNMPEVINKINENFEENKNNSLNFLNMISKIYNKYIDLYKKYKNHSIEYEKNNLLKNQKNLKNEENLKNNIISMTKENIEKFSPMCFNNNAKDLKLELKNLNQNSYNMSSYDVLNASLDILGKLLLRTSSFKNEKELEIENLNGKIIYLLSELDIYKRNISSNKDNPNNKTDIQLLNNQLSLKEDEINRLNKDIEEYLVKIKELSCENELLRNAQKSRINSKKNYENKDTRNKYPYDNFGNNNYNKINYVNEINNKYKNINNIIKSNNIQDNKNELHSDNNYDSDKLSEKIIENDLAKNQNDIDKINAQLRELSQLENGNMNNYENKKK